MVKVREDLTGKVFGRLTVIRQTEDYICQNGRRYAQWLCECNCEEHNIVEVISIDLKRGHTASCGCLQKERASENKRYNKYSEKLCDEFGEYYIGYTSNTGKEFYIDADDYDKIKNYCWCECVQNRIFHTIITHTDDYKKISMHKLLGFKWCDHIDRNELNNRKHNLRPCTAQENRRNSSKRKDNTSGIIGVSWIKATNKWKAEIKLNYKNKYLGCFINKDDAIKVRLQAERDYFGEFAPQQHLFEQYGIEPITKQSD